MLPLRYSRPGVTAPLLAAMMTLCCLVLTYSCLAATGLVSDLELNLEYDT